MQCGGRLLYVIAKRTTAASLHSDLRNLALAEEAGFFDAPQAARRGTRLSVTRLPPVYLEFASRRDGMIHAMDGGLWLHRHVWKGRPMAHLVSTDRARLLAYGAAIGIAAERLQFKPLKDPRTGVRRDAWHWDLGGPFLPPPRPANARD
jgi:hypothetical protein